MVAPAAEVGGDAAELHRRPQKGAPQGIAVFVVVADPVGGLEAEGVELFPRVEERRRVELARTDLALLGNPALDQQREAVTGLDVPAEVHRPGVDLRQLPGEPHPVAPGEQGIGNSGVERIVERRGDRALDPGHFTPPGDRAALGFPGVVRHPTHREPEVGAGPDPGLIRQRIARVAPETHHHAGAEAPRVEPGPLEQAGQIEPEKALAAEEVAQGLPVPQGVAGYHNNRGLGRNRLHGRQRPRLQAAPRPAPLKGEDQGGHDDRQRQRKGKSPHHFSPFAAG